MGRNTIGGKQYKKTKHSSEAPKYQTREHDQQWARVIRILGNRNTLAYCNDNVVRLCHIRGSIRKDTWINVGDIVLVSLRELGNDKEKYEKADILYRFEREFHSKLKKEDLINQKLFLQLELSTEENLKKLQTTQLSKEDEDYFEEEDNQEEDEVDVDAI